MTAIRAAMGTMPDQRSWTVRETHIEPEVTIRRQVTDEARAALSAVEPQCSLVRPTEWSRGAGASRIVAATSATSVMPVSGTAMSRFFQ